MFKGCFILLFCIVLQLFGNCQSRSLKQNVITKNKICDDVPPDNKYTCAQQKEFGKCDVSWMIQAGYCDSTCGRCQE